MFPYFLNSLLLHALILLVFLTLSVSRHSATAKSSKEYSVYLKERVEKAEKKPPSTDEVVKPTQGVKTEKPSGTLMEMPVVKALDRPAEIEGTLKDSRPKATEFAIEKKESVEVKDAHQEMQTAEIDRGAVLSSPYDKNSQKAHPLSEPSSENIPGPKIIEIEETPPPRVLIEQDEDKGPMMEGIEKKPSATVPDVLIDRPFQTNGQATTSLIIPEKDVKEVKGEKPETTGKANKATKGSPEEASVTAGERPAMKVPFLSEAPQENSTSAYGTGASQPSAPETALNGDNPDSELPHVDVPDQTAEVEPQAGKETKPEEKEAFLRVPVAETLLSKDIKIEILFGDAEVSGISVHLFKNSHPSVYEKKPGKDRELHLSDETVETRTEGRVRSKRIFSVAGAEKGTYTLVMENKAEKTYISDVVFRLYEGKEKGRIKEYKAVKLPADTGVRFKFVLPDMVFWDDEDRFSGSIEDSNSVTKFDYETGFMWKEEKD